MIIINKSSKKLLKQNFLHRLGYTTNLWPVDLHIYKFFELFCFSKFTDDVQVILINVLLVFVKIFKFIVHCLVLEAMRLN